MRTSTLRYRKNDPVHNVLVATQRLIKARGGSAVVIGGIGIMHRAGIACECAAQMHAIGSEGRQG